MAYVTVMGGQEAIERSSELTEAYRLRHPDLSLPVKSVQYRMRYLADRIMSEGGLYEPTFAALALKQAEGDPFEAAFLLRAYRSTLPRIGYSLTADTSEIRVIRRISSTFRDVPGGQVLGPNYDYTHKLLDFSLLDEDIAAQRLFMDEWTSDGAEEKESHGHLYGKVSEMLRKNGLLAEPAEGPWEEPFDITRQKLTFPAPRSARLQALARGETGAMNALAYSSMRGFGNVHPTIGELKVGYVPVYVPYPFDEEEHDSDHAVYLGEVLVTEVESINSFTQNKESGAVEFLMGYGLCYGQNEVKAISMSILERSLEIGRGHPSQDEEFVLQHIDGVESYGFVSHLKLPHYITFQSALDRIRIAQEHKKDSEYLNNK